MGAYLHVLPVLADFSLGFILQHLKINADSALLQGLLMTFLTTTIARRILGRTLTHTRLLGSSS